MLEEFPHKRHFEKGRKAVYGECELNESVASVLESRGISKLYRHQCEGIGKVRDGKNVVVVAPTASGKSELYLVPVVEAALRNKRSLVIYPTKALSRDQLARFREFALLGVRSEVYDGDTTQHEREKIRKNLPHIIITNIDMLHFMLMNQRLFAAFWKGLRYVVLDELHYYSGVLGSHAANIISRLKRVAAKHAANSPHPPLQFVCTSATIKNALEFAETIAGEKFGLVNADDAPKSPFEHFIITPEDVGYTTASLRIAQELKKKALIFGNSHSVVERLGAMAADEDYGLRVYRAGLDNGHRKRLEVDFRAGKFEALATTSALELGMDIGSVDAVILAGFPGTITRVRQRIGRAGRKGQKAYAVFVARENPLDQYYSENPEKYLRGEPESCYANPANENIRKFHLLAKSRDMPLSEEEMAGDERKLAEGLCSSGMLKEWAGGLIPTKEGLKELRTKGIRGAGEPVRIFDSDARKFIGEREEHMAMGELFEGALYMHGGEKFASEKLDLKERIAYVRRSFDRSTEITLPIRERNAEEIELFGERQCLGRRLCLGRVHVVDEVVGCTRKDYFTDKVVSKRYFDEPLHREFDTHAVWLDFDFACDVEDFANGLHALEHVSISMMPALTGADPGELGGISYPNGRMYVYDGVPDGNGVTKIVYGRFEEVVGMALERLRGCKCESGCPKCILDPMCGNQNRFLDKKAGLAIAEKFTSVQAGP